MPNPVPVEDVTAAVQRHAAQPAEERGKRSRRLGPFLCWAVVFADIGTSVYYVPGILFGSGPHNGVGTHAALFVLMTMAAFVLLSFKYAEVTIRYPEGGGVVTVGTRALHPLVGLIGGMFILVDYFLTAALSAVSGVAYLSFVLPSLNSNLTIGISAIVALIVLGLLNWVGISESAKVSAAFATVAFLSQFAIVLAVVSHLGLANALGAFHRVTAGPRIAPLGLLTGFAGAFLAFSGLESISQLSPVMKEPRARVARIAMGAVVGSIALTSPLLTLWSTTLLNANTIYANAASNNLLSLLAQAITGKWLGVEVAITGSILLIFACNTAIIGSYHVFLAISRMRFFPEFIQRRNLLRGTPHYAILLAVGIPVLILIPASLSPDTQTILGDLYAFGLLGAFSVTCVSLDVVRWREQRAAVRAASGPAIAAHPVPDGSARVRHHDHDAEVTPSHEQSRHLLARVNFVVGVVTTLLVVVAWSTNLVNKPLATAFGGTVSTIGLIVALVNYERLGRRGLAVAFPSTVRSALPDAVMVLLPNVANNYEALVRTAANAAGSRPVVFVYRGTERMPERRPGIFEVVDPYLYDSAAQDAMGRAERLARRLRLDRRYVYIPANAGPDAVTRVWQTIRPRDTIAAGDEEAVLHEIAPDRIRRPAGAGAPIVHYLKHW